MTIIWVKILLTVLGVLLGLAAIVASWVVFTILDGLFQFFHHREKRDL